MNSDVANFSIPSLRALPPVFRWLAGAVMLTLTIGYAHALVYVYVTTGVHPKGITDRYRGSEPSAASAPATQTMGGYYAPDSTDSPSTDLRGTAAPNAEIQYEKSLPEMLNIIHTHILSMTMIFALSGFITAFTRGFSPRLRKYIIVEPFVGIVVTFFGLWLTRYVGHGWSWLVMVSGVVMALAFGLQLFAVSTEFFRNPTRDA